MSRSYKRAVLKYAPERGKPGKQLANRAVRRFKGPIPDGCWYKKLFCSWEIHDWISYLEQGPGEWLPKGSFKTRSGWKMPK